MNSNKWPKITGLILATFALTGCSLFTNAANYANSFDVTAFEFVKTEGTISYEQNGSDLEVYFTDETTGAKVLLNNTEKVASFGIAKTTFDKMRFDGSDSVATGYYSRFSLSDISGSEALYYNDVINEAATDTIPYTTYYYSSKIVSLDAYALRVTSVNEDLKDSLPQGFSKYADIEVGDYLNIYIATTGDGIKGAEIAPFTTDTINGVLFAETQTESDGSNTSDATSGTVTITQVYFADATDSENKYMLEDVSSTTTVINYRYFDLEDSDGNVLVAAPSADNLSMIGDILYYDVYSGSTITTRYSISMSDVKLDQITEINSVMSGNFTSLDETLGVGDFNGVHLLATPVALD